MAKSKSVTNSFALRPTKDLNQNGLDAFVTGGSEVRNQNLILAGKTIANRFQLKRLLGSGGMGEVWLAEEKRNKKPFALKFIKPELLPSEDALSRLHKEYEVLENLSHPHIVKVFDLDQDSTTERWFIRMEYLEGEDLGKVMTVAKKDTKLPLFEIEQVLNWLSQIGDALAYMHKQGIVHRDIKPTNLMLTKNQELKLMDFGIARTLTGTHHTQHTAMMGTLFYTAPEVLLGQTATTASDMYSVGVLAYELLTGKIPVGRFPNPSEVLKVSFVFDDMIDELLDMDAHWRPKLLSEVLDPIREKSNTDTDEEGEDEEEDDEETEEEPQKLPQTKVFTLEKVMQQITKIKPQLDKKFAQAAEDLKCVDRACVILEGVSPALFDENLLSELEEAPVSKRFLPNSSKEITPRNLLEEYLERKIGFPDVNYNISYYPEGQEVLITFGNK